MIFRERVRGSLAGGAATVLAGVLIVTSVLAIQWTLLLLWIGGTAALVACIVLRARQSGQPPRVSLLFDAPPPGRRPNRRPSPR